MPCQTTNIGDQPVTICHRCEDSAESYAAPIEICGTCWLTKPCDCEDPQ